MQLTQLQLNAKGDEKIISSNLRSQGKPAALNVDLQGSFDPAMPNAGSQS